MGEQVLTSSVRYLIVLEDCWEIVGGQPEMAVPLLKGHPGVPYRHLGWPPHPRHFGKRGCKRLKTKGGSAEKRAKRAARGCKLLTTKELQETAQHRGRGVRSTEPTEGDTPGDLHRCERKGVAGRGICKFLILKGRRDSPQRARRAQRFGGGATRKGWEAIFTVYDSTEVNECQ